MNFDFNLSAENGYATTKINFVKMNLIKSELNSQN